MSQNDMQLANQAGAAFRTDLNSALKALATMSSGATEPDTTNTGGYHLWADTTTNLWKRRNAANSGWIVVGTLAETFFTARSSNTVLGAADVGKTFRATASFTQTVTAAATLGDGWFCDYIVASGVTTVFSPASGTIDGASTLSVTGPGFIRIVCSGSAFYTSYVSSLPALGTARQVLEVNSGATAGQWADRVGIATSASVSGTSTQINGVPASARIVKVGLIGVTIASEITMQIGPSTTPEASGYHSGLSGLNYTAAFSLTPGTDSNASGLITLFRTTGNTWAASGAVYNSANADYKTYAVAGSKSLSGALGCVSLSGSGGQSFSAGSFNVSWQ